MPCRPWQHVVRRLEPSHMPRPIVALQRAEAQEGMQMGRLPPNHLDPAMQLAAVDIACHSGAGVTLGNPPEHAIQQAPSLIGAKAGGHLQFFEQLAGDSNARPVRGR